MKERERSAFDVQRRGVSFLEMFEAALRQRPRQDIIPEMFEEHHFCFFLLSISGLVVGGAMKVARVDI